MIDLKTVKSLITSKIINIPGWTTNRKIIVIESDDWGSIRMPSIDVFNIFLKKGYKVDSCNFNRLDSLESNNDLIALYEVLSSFRDMYGNYPVFTANCLVANPDFHKIKESFYTTYYYENVRETLLRYPNHDKVFELWHEGIRQNLFFPQFHGREHLNIQKWMKALKDDTDDIRFTFRYNTTYSGIDDYNYMGSFEQTCADELLYHAETIYDGLKIFKKLFGYSSKSFIAPCYIWSPLLEKTLAHNEVCYIQGNLIQLIPDTDHNKYNKKYHYLGQKNIYKQRYLLRNCSFEPALYKNNNPIEYTLNSIASAFKWKKPAIISSHRINYIGSIYENNRTDNLMLLNNLIKNILKQWPDAEFISSDKLGDIIVADEQR